MSTARKALRARLNRPGIIVAPGAYDSLMARLVERAGFPAVYLTGAGVSNSLLGQPDVGLVTLTEMVTRAAYVAEAVQIPVIADADTGYGNALNVQRTVRQYERAGVAAIQLEDQATPKRCGHFEGKELVSAAEMVAKIKAALDVRIDPDLVIIARTDAIAPLGLAAALERAQRYAEAGADVIFVEAPQSVEQMRAITGALSAPLLANMVEGGKTPLLPATELEALGYKLAIFPGSLTRFLTRAAAELLSGLKTEGSTRAFLDRMFTFTEVNEILGLPEVMQREARYAVEEGS